MLGHPSRPAHAIWTLPAFLAEAPAPLGTGGWDFPFCHPARGSATSCRLWMVAWGILVWAKQPASSILTSHAWGRKGKQTGYASKVKGRTLCYPALPCPVYSVPTQAGVKTARESSGSPQLETEMLQRPHFQHLLRGKAPRCESGLHLAGSGEKFAICCPVPPLPPPSTRQGWKEAGWDVEETVLSGWTLEGLVVIC